MTTLLDRPAAWARPAVPCLTLVLLCANAICAETDARPAQSLTAEELLARANTALGWEHVASHPGHVRVQADARLRGTEALQVELFDGDGRSLQTFEGPLPGASGFDGTTTWTVDWTGTPRILELEEALTAQMSADFLHGSWAAPGHLLEFTAVAREGDLWVMEFAPPGGYPRGSVHLDADTFLPRVARWRTASSESVWTFEEFGDHAGYRFPARLTIEQSGVVQDLRTRKVEFLEGAQEALFAPRLDRPGDTRFDALASPELELKRAPTGHLLVHPTIDGQELGWFIFDTGAGTNCISNSVVERLGSEPFGEVPVQGIGGKLLSRFWRADQLQLGPLTVEDPVFIGLDLEFLNAPFGVEVAGILGYELLARCTVEFDQSAPYIALFDPELYELGGDGAWQDVLLLDRHPCVRASVEGHEGVFKIDTGAAADTVTMHAPAVELLSLLEDRKTSASSAGGVGGSVPVRSGELSGFLLGGHQFGTISADFATEETGVFGNPQVWGNIGGRLLEPFLLVFDYPHRRLGFVLK